MITLEKAEIIGLLCAEGNYYDRRLSYWEHYKNCGKDYFKSNKRCVYIQFSNFNLDLLKRFQDLVFLEYAYLPNINKDRVRICKRKIIKDLLNYSNYGCLNWKIPKEIMKNKGLSPSFLRGYFEGDGCASNFTFGSSNLKGLRQVQKVLFNLNIDNSLYGPEIRKDFEPYYKVYIKKRSCNLFLKIVKPIYKLPKTL
ncbi:MAG: LAGLIDADG family homing endonuclease [Nanoarchaeota archaeon]